MEENKTLASHQVETDMDAQMSIQEVIPTLNGEAQEKQILFHIYDETEEELNEIMTSITLDEAKELITSLQNMVDAS